MNLIFTYILLIICTFAAWNSFCIIWKLEGTHSKTWHSIGWVIRLELALLILALMYFNPDFHFTWKLFAFWGLAFLNTAWILYDFIINLFWTLFGKLNDVWHVDPKKLNGWLLKKIGKKSIWIFRGVLILINIIILAI